MNSNVSVSQDRLAEFCRANGITRLAIFGSCLRDDFGPESDIDLLVEFGPGRTPGLGFVSMAEELSEIFGRQVDVLTRSSVERSQNYIRRKAILDSAETIYAASSNPLRSASASASQSKSSTTGASRV